MKKLILFSLLSILLVDYHAECKNATITTEIQSAYCDGWADGYVAGYCYNESNGCIKPMVPMCPMAEIGKNTYQDGYNRGFLRGMADGR